MNIKSIKLNYGRTVNLGNYESLRIDIELAATIDNNDEVVTTTANLRQMAKLEAMKIIQYEIKKRNDLEDYY